MNEDQPQNRPEGGVPSTDDKYPTELKAKAREFFRRASEVAYALQFDYAVELYLDGLNFWPDALEEGHGPLREVALRRQQAGGKKSGFTDSSRYKKLTGKNPKDAMLKAEYLLCKEPANTSHMTDMIKGALEGGYSQTALWMSNILFEFNRTKDKPSLQTFLFLRDSYAKLEVFARALQACQQALNIKPNDAALQDSLRDLSAQATMQQGRYDSDGDFRDSIKDRQTQERMHSQELLVHSEASQADLIGQARRDYEAEPGEHGKLSRLIDALVETEKDEHENEAMRLLEEAYAQSQQFRYRQRSGTIKIKQIRRKIRQCQEQINESGADDALTEQLEELTRQQLAAELEHYQLCVNNYPTDLGLKYELGRRLLQAGKYDDAIPVFQKSRTDPRHRLASLNHIGQCFFYKEWYADAVDTFQQALEAVETSEDSMAKELRYNLGRAYEADGKIDEAVQCYRKIAQIDFTYRDVKERIDMLRKKTNDAG
ncbi:MAG: tetratricopeptide repeat protein [Sedimentisphaerales bacterium]|nr:tetratricopeptide repeat protein [Sedimentisphaerales bacterium]